MPLSAAAIGLALFLAGFGSGGNRNGDCRMVALSIGLAGAVVFVAGLAALAPIVPPGV